MLSDFYLSSNIPDIDVTQIIVWPR